MFAVHSLTPLNSICQLERRHANHAVFPSLVPHQVPGGVAGARFHRESQDRHNRLQSLLAATSSSGSIDVAVAKRALADRGGSGFPICCHAGESCAQISTTAAYVADLQQGVLWVAIGAPDSNKFVRYSFEDDDGAAPKL